jgi:hypothetical protein
MRPRPGLMVAPSDGETVRADLRSGNSAVNGVRRAVEPLFHPVGFLTDRRSYAPQLRPHPLAAPDLDWTADSAPGTCARSARKPGTQCARAHAHAHARAYRIHCCTAHTLASARALRLAARTHRRARTYARTYARTHAHSRYARTGPHTHTHLHAHAHARVWRTG